MLVKNAFVWRMCNPNSYHVDIKKENHINNMSCVLIKKCVAHNHKFILITAGTEILVHLK